MIIFFILLFAACSVDLITGLLAMCIVCAWISGVLWLFKRCWWLALILLVLLI